MSDSLGVIRQEFKGKIDTETDVMLRKFQELLSPELITDPTERETLEVLFIGEIGSDFENASFSGFVQTIYDQPDDIISEETKQTIEAKFNIPRKPILTGEQLIEEMGRKDTEGNFQYGSTDKGLEFRRGVKSFVNQKGEIQFAVMGESKAAPIDSSGLEGVPIADVANYSIVRQIVYEEMHGLTNLFGGGGETSITGVPESAIRNGVRFMNLLVTRRKHEEIMTPEDIQNFRNALRVIRPISADESSDSLSAMADLGLWVKGDLQWDRITQAGRILTTNDFYTATSLINPNYGHSDLKAKLTPENKERRSTYERQRKTHKNSNF